MDWLWQGLLTNWLSMFLVFTGAAVLGFLRHKNSRWTQPILYGIAAFALLGIARFSFQGYRYFASQPPPLNQADLEPTIKRWLDAFHESVSSLSDPTSDFNLAVAVQSGGTVQVIRSKEYHRYVIMKAQVEMLPEHVTMLNSLPKDQRQLVMDESIMQLVRTGINYAFAGPPELPIRKIVLEKRLLITNQLTEQEFIDALTEMDFGLMEARATLVTEMERNGLRRFDTKPSLP